MYKKLKEMNNKDSAGGRNGDQGCSSLENMLVKLEKTD